ncbi:UNVERIFIED_CONTAM: MFS family permease [Brevibacillus sp. OAP136]
MPTQPEHANDVDALQRPQRLWTKSFITMTLCNFLLFLCLQMLLSPFPTYVKDRFHPDDFIVSLVTSMFALAAIVTRFITAALMRKVHRNVLLFCGLLFAAIATAFYSYPTTIGGVLALRICFGIGFGMSSTLMPTIVSQIIPARRIGEGIGYFGLSMSLAMSFGPMIGLSMLANYGFAPLSYLGAVAAALIVPLLISTRSLPPEQKKPAASKPGEKKPGFNTKLLFPALLNFLISVTYGGLLSFLALFGKEVHLANIGLFFLFNVITILIVRPISGRIFDKRGHGAVLIPSAVFVVASLLVLSFTTTLPMLILSALLYGLGFGAIQPTLQAWMLRVSAPEQHGVANSMYFNSLDFGVAIGAMALGIIASHSSYAMTYRTASGVMVLFLVIYTIAQVVGRGRRRAALPKLQEVTPE